MEEMLISSLLLVMITGCVYTETTTSGNLEAPSSQTDIDVRPPPNAVQLPSWIKCLQQPKSFNRSQIADIGLNSLYWCQNQDIIIPCLEREVPATSESNPIDYITSLSLVGENLQKITEELCSRLPEEVEEELNCVENSSSLAINGCSMVFKQWVDYIFYIRDKPDVTMVTVTNVSCEATKETSRCLDIVLSTCSLATKSFLLGYYGIFSSASCVVNATLPSQNIRKLESSEQTILMKCGMEASSNMDNNQVIVNATVESVLVNILLQDCGLYRQRLMCYDREFPTATTFLDLWQKQVFGLDRALAANQLFCSKVTDFVKELSTECVRSLDEALQICEEKYGATLRTKENDFIIGKISLTDLQPLACNASLDRVECLRQAFEVCSNSAAQLYATSQSSMLPLSCFNQTSTKSMSNVLITLATTATSTNDVSSTVTSASEATLIPRDENRLLLESTTHLMSFHDQLQPNIPPITSENKKNPPHPNNKPIKNDNPNEELVKNDNSYNEPFNKQTVVGSRQAFSGSSKRNPSQAAITTTKGDNPNSSAIPTFSYILVFLFVVPII